VGRHLVEIEPENAGNCVIPSTLYASARRMEDVRNVSELMMEKASCDRGDWKKLD
jgi:hypothetical protein